MIAHIQSIRLGLRNLRADALPCLLPALWPLTEGSPTLRRADALAEFDPDGLAIVTSEVTADNGKA